MTKDIEIEIVYTVYAPSARDVEEDLEYYLKWAQTEYGQPIVRQKRR